MKTREKNIISQMFDVRPVDRDGNFDLEKAGRSNRVIRIEEKEKTRQQVRNPNIFSDIVKNEKLPFEMKNKPEEGRAACVYQMGNAYPSEEVPIFFEVDMSGMPAREIFSQTGQAPTTDRNIEIESWEDSACEAEKGRSFSNFSFWNKELIFYAAGTACLIVMAASVAFFAQKGNQIKGKVLGEGMVAYMNLAQAKEEILNKNFQNSEFKFNEAYDNFSSISEDLNSFGSLLVDASRYLPYVSKLSTGAALAEIGKDISRIGILAGRIMRNMDDLKNPLNADNADISLLSIFQDTDKDVKEIQLRLKNIDKNIKKINLDDMPEEQKNNFLELKKRLPEINVFIDEFVGNSHIFTDVLGGNGPRKYLFLFQNNHEMRATGGFIGTYGALDIFNGRISKFFIDGIYNPDGQLREKVVPPAPIQKISAAWSLHDSNWFPDFPVSAEKAAWFYEKTGGPTVDGVITMTPVVMQKLLEVTGPIEMPEYGVTIDGYNFIEKVQQEVESDYDKELNQPKKILADLAPKVLDKIFNAKNFSDVARTMSILSESLKEKQILIYSKNYDIQAELSELGWSGEILATQKDYLSVINTNINGFKTDGVIEEKIEHLAEIREDGSIIDTVTITRHHKGGNTEYDWWNRVNANYMRVYVPKGSELLSVEGHTREFNSPPLDYDALGFKRDPQVRMEEDSINIDESGTRVYEDAGKTVFGNWTYVSPQEKSVMTYKYLLPFRIWETDRISDTYSLLAQKQAGSIGSKFVSEIKFPSNYKINWKYPDESSESGNGLRFETYLKTDKFTGVAFMKYQ
ncbi:MAG TPA: hypothetical protein DIT25_03790 [Candidatus Moranbacteria bacterium]|nr:hypothetical protein [Candidatus Moranbacteria bacterium]